MKIIRKMKKHDWAGNTYTIEILYHLGRYEIRVDGEFWGTAETEFQAWEEVSGIIQAYHLH